MTKPKFKLGDIIYAVQVLGDLDSSPELAIYRGEIRAVRMGLNDSYWCYEVDCYNVTDDPKNKNFLTLLSEYKEIPEIKLFKRLQDSMDFVVKNYFDYIELRQEQLVNAKRIFAAQLD